MGALRWGIPQQITIELAKLNGSSLFIETGTFQGNTTRWAASCFDKVYTIERAEILYRRHSEELSKIEGVTPLLGDSAVVLPQVVSEIGDQSAVFWLDGHWSGGVTAGEGDECPLMEELACLAGREEDIILIDDARLFLCAPPLPHQATEWPTVPDILNAFPDRSGKFVQIVDDVIFIIPDKEPLRSSLVKYAQERSTEVWNERKRANTTPVIRLKNYLSQMKRKIAKG